MPRNPHRYGIDQRPPRSGGTSLRLETSTDRLTPLGKELVRGRQKINRAGLVVTSVIAGEMAIDIAELVAASGAATQADLKTLGWTAAQIEKCGETASTIAQAGLVRQLPARRAGTAGEIAR